MKKELFSVPNPFEFDEVPDYLDNEIEGRPVYSLTFYYINPRKWVGRARRSHPFHWYDHNCNNLIFHAPAIIQPIIPPTGRGES